jgi:hypothetical protein
MEPDFRVPFWAFPHVSVDPVTSTSAVSGLYDTLLSSSLSRLAAAVPTRGSGGGSSQLGLSLGLAATSVLALVGWALLLRERREKRRLPDEQIAFLAEHDLAGKGHSVGVVV